MIKIGDIPKDCIRTNTGMIVNVFKPKANMIHLNRDAEKS